MNPNRMPSSSPRTWALLAWVVLAWGSSWPVSKLTLEYLTPLWASAARTTLACLLLWVVVIGLRRLTVPPRHDLPVVFSVSLLHMVGFSVLANVGLQYVAAGRSVVLAYTTPLWVLPLAWMFLREPLSPRRLAGLACGMAGLLALFLGPGSPPAGTGALAGNGLILLAALLWAVSIVYSRGHRWRTTPFQLLPWQVLLACIVQLVLAWAVEGPPAFEPDGTLAALLLYNSVVGTVLAYWAMNTVNRDMAAGTVSLGLLGVPLAGLLISGHVLHEPFTPELLAGAALILAGVFFGSFETRAAGRFSRRKMRRSREP